MVSEVPYFYYTPDFKIRRCVYEQYVYKVTIDLIKGSFFLELVFTKQKLGTFMNTVL